MNKKELRAYIREKKAALSDKEVDIRSEGILSLLYAQECYKQNDKIYTYVNYNQEINTKSLILHSLKLQKNVYVPKVFGAEMIFFRIEGLKDLSPGAYGILEPKDDLGVERVDSNPSGLMIMPGLAFDNCGNRIGYGGGFYDRYLKKYPSFYKAALCFDFQIIDKIDADDFDIPVDMVISESKSLVTGRVL